MTQEEKILQEAMEVIYKEALEQGIFEGLTEDATEDTYDPSATLQENRGFNNRGNVVTKTKQARINWLKSRSALAMAKAKGDPLYKKLVKFAKLRRQYIALLNKKYMSGANKRAKELIKNYKSNTGNVFSGTPAKSHIKMTPHQPAK